MNCQQFLINDQHLEIDNLIKIFDFEQKDIYSLQHDNFTRTRKINKIFYLLLRYVSKDAPTCLRKYNNVLLWIKGHLFSTMYKKKGR